MVALLPITATPTLPGFARPAPVSQSGFASSPAQPGNGSPIGGGAASSAIANETRRSLVEQAKQVQGTDDTGANSRPRAKLPSPPYAQNVGLYENSTRVYVDIVLSGDESRRVARVFGTPPTPAPPQATRSAAPSRESVNFVA